MLKAWLKKVDSDIKLPSKPCLPDPTYQVDLKKAVRMTLVNDAISATPEYSGEKNSKRSKSYGVYTAEQRLQIAKWSSQFGPASASRHFTEILQRPVNESTVRSMVKQYMKAIREDGEVTALPHSKRGRPTLLASDVDEEVRSALRDVRLEGGPIFASTVIATGRSIVEETDRSLLSEYGGNIELGRPWAVSLLRLGYVKRKEAKTHGKLAEDFDLVRERFLERFRSATLDNDVPDELIINFDQTGIDVVPISNWIMAQEGAKQLSITAIDDKRHLTAVMACSMTGYFLPLQMIYTGKTEKCLPNFKFPSEWDITYSENHWSNETTMLQYVENILVPYFVNTKKQLKLPEEQKTIVLMDVFAVHRTDKFLSALKAHHIIPVFLPASCTGELQPLELHGNRELKDLLKKAFISWFADQVRDWRKRKNTDDEAKLEVDFRLSIIKPLHAQWLLKAFNQLKRCSGVFVNGWKKAGLLDLHIPDLPTMEASDNSFRPDDSFIVS